MKQYRIRTEEEFINHYGGDWRKIERTASFVSGMDKYFGSIITEKEFQELKDIGRFYRNGYVYKEKMIIEVNQPILITKNGLLNGTI